jgi:hypothetical protein
MAPAESRHRLSLAASLLAEIAVGLGLVVVLAGRSDLDAFAVALPVSLVAGAAGLLAFAVRSRALFWCGVVGAIAGALMAKPPLCVLFSPNVDPADVKLTWCRMIAETNLQFAITGGTLGIAVGYVLARHRLRRQLRESR